MSPGMMAAAMEAAVAVEGGNLTAGALLESQLD